MRLIYSSHTQTFKTSTGALIALEKSLVVGQEPVIKIETVGSFSSLEDVPEGILSNQDKVFLKGLIANDK